MNCVNQILLTLFKSSGAFSKTKIDDLETELERETFMALFPIQLQCRFNMLDRLWKRINKES